MTFKAYIFGNNSSICKKPCRAYDKSAIYHDRNLRKAAYKLIVDKLKESEPKANKDAVVKKINNLRKIFCLFPAVPFARAKLRQNLLVLTRRRQSIPF